MDIIFHMLIPVMLAAIAGLDKKKAFLLGPVAVIPDLDTLLTAHRVYFHTVFIPIIIALVSFAHVWKKSWKPHCQIVFVSSLFYLSHLFLDFFSGSVALLWPSSSVGYGLYVSVTVTQHSILPVASGVIRIDAQEIPIPNIVTDVVAASPQSIGVSLLLFFTLTLCKRKILNMGQGRKNSKQSSMGINEKGEE